MSEQIKVKIQSTKGIQEIELSTRDYKEAKEQGCTVSQLVERKFGADVDAGKHGRVIAQLQAAAGMQLNNDPFTGVKQRTFQDVWAGKHVHPEVAITKDAEALVRYLTPITMLGLMEEQLKSDYSSDVAQFEKMIGLNITIADDHYARPIIDLGKSGDERSAQISQLATPKIMGQLTVSERLGTIPTYSIGLEMSDKARKAYTFDQVSKILARQVECERLDRIAGYVNDLVEGNKDTDQAALKRVKASDFDASATGGKLTQTALRNWMWSHRRYARFDWLIMDLKTFDKFEKREGRTTIMTAPVGYPQLAEYATKVANADVDNPTVFIVDEGVIPANCIVGMDSRYAITRIRNSEAEFNAAEELIMRRGTQMRFDFGEVVMRNYEEAWSLLELA